MSAVRQALARRSPFAARTAILAVVVCALLVSMLFPLRQLLTDRSHVAQLIRQTQVLERQNRTLQARIQQLHDPPYLERLARECIGMVRPGEIPFAIVSGAGGSRPARC